MLLNRLNAGDAAGAPSHLVLLGRCGGGPGGGVVLPGGGPPAAGPFAKAKADVRPGGGYQALPAAGPSGDCPDLPARCEAAADACAADCAADFADCAADCAGDPAAQGAAIGPGYCSAFSQVVALCVAVLLAAGCACVAASVLRGGGVQLYHPGRVHGGLLTHVIPGALRGPAQRPALGPAVTWGSGASEEEACGLPSWAPKSGEESPEAAAFVVQARREWCCEHKLIGCSGFDCTSDTAGWSATQRRWCCKLQGRGCAFLAGQSYEVAQSPEPGSGESESEWTPAAGEAGP